MRYPRSLTCQSHTLGDILQNRQFLMEVDDLVEANLPFSTRHPRILSKKEFLHDPHSLPVRSLFPKEFRHRLLHPPSRQLIDRCVDIRLQHFGEHIVDQVCAITAGKARQWPVHARRPRLDGV